MPELPQSPDSGVSTEAVRNGPPVEGTSVGKFRVTQVLPPGPAGPEYLAEDGESGDVVVLRFLPELVLHAGEEAVRGFLQEARAAAGVHHPNLLRLLKVGKDAGELFIVTEFYSADSAADYIAANGPMSVREATRVAAAVGRALQAITEAGLTHRDIRPETILRGIDGTVRLAGLGLTRLIEELQQFKLGMPIASPHYCSPEFYRDGVADGRSDVYCLGAAYFTLLTGRTPYTADTSMQVLHRHVAEAPPDPRELVPGLPDRCFEIISKAMAKAPDDRFASPASLCDEFDKLVELLPPETAAAPMPAASPSGKSGTFRKKEASSERNKSLVSERNSPLSGSSATMRPVGPKAGGGSGGRELSTSMRAIAVRSGNTPRKGGAIAGWLVALVLMLLVAAAGVAVVVVRRTTEDQVPVPPKTDDKIADPGDTGKTPKDPEVKDPVIITPDPDPDPDPKTRIEPPKQAPPMPAEESVRLLEQRLDGWNQEGGKWSIAGGVLTGESSDKPTSLTAKMTSVDFRLAWRMETETAESVEVAFNHGRTGHALLRLDKEGYVRLVGVNTADGSREQFGFQKLATGAHDFQLMTEGRGIALYVDDNRLLHVARGPLPAPDDMRLSLRSVGGKSKFRNLVWVPQGATPSQTRLHALAALTHFKSPDAESRIGRVLDKPDGFESIVVELVGLLEKSGSAGSVDRLRKLSERADAAPELLRRTLDALATQPGAPVVEAIRKRLNHTDASVRQAAVKAFGKRAAAEKSTVAEAGAAVRPLLRDPDLEVRRRAAAALGEIKDPGSIDALVAAARDPAIDEHAIAALLVFPPDLRCLDAYITGLSIASTASGSRNRIEEGAAVLKPAILEAADMGRIPHEAAGVVADSLDQLRIRHWRIAGPFAAGVGDVLNIAEFSAKPDFALKYKGVRGDVAWKQVVAGDDGRLDWRGLMGSDENWVGFAFATFELADTDGIEMTAVVDDVLKAWVNGIAVGELKLNEAGILRAAVKPGINTLMIRVENTGRGDWYSSVRIGRSKTGDAIRKPAIVQLFEDSPWLVDQIRNDRGPIALETADVFSGHAALRVGPPQRHHDRVSGWDFPIVENPGPGQYRYARFAWKKLGGEQCVLWFAGDGKWGDTNNPAKSFRYSQGKKHPVKGAIQLGNAIPEKWQEHTVDLFTHFGAFRLTGMNVQAVDGQAILLDRLHLARTPEDFNRLPPPRAAPASN